MMNVLFVAPYVPSTIRVRSWHVIHSLLNRGNSVTLAALWTDDQEKDILLGLQAKGVSVIAQRSSLLRTAWNVLQAFPTKEPLQSYWAWYPSLVERIADTIKKDRVDVVHVEHLRGSKYGMWVKTRVPRDIRGCVPPVVYDNVDCMSLLYSQAKEHGRGAKIRAITALDLERTRRYESVLATAFPRMVVTSDVDRSALLDLVRTYDTERFDEAVASICVVPNGVDLERFKFRDQSQRAPARLIFTGKMSYHPNFAAAHFLVSKVMPRVWQVRDDAELWLVGEDPNSEMTHWQQQYGGKVRVTGKVPDMSEPLGEATISVAPLLYGAGIQNKVLEAMACGTPVVATPRATAAITAQDGQDLLVAEGAEALANSVFLLLDNAQLRQRLGAAGRAFVTRNHSWDTAAQRFEVMYAEARAMMRKEHQRS